MNKQEVIQLCGLPFSGKSTFARELKLIRPELEIVSFEDQRNKLLIGNYQLPSNKLDEWAAVTKRKMETLRVGLLLGLSQVDDGVNPKREERDQAKEMADDLNAIRLLIYFDLPEEVLLERMSNNLLLQRRNLVRPENLEKIKDQFQQPDSTEEPIVVFRTEAEVNRYLNTKFSRKS
jgi:predicted kinase